MDTTRAAPSPAAGGPGSADEDWETVVLGRRRTAPPFPGHPRVPAEPIYAELVGQWRALGRTVPVPPPAGAPSPSVPSPAPVPRPDSGLTLLESLQSRQFLHPPLHPH